MTVLTGETGAGKSIVIDAINVLLGERAGTELVRTGTARALLQATFDVSGLPSDSTSRQQSRSPEVSPVGPPRPDSGILDVTCPVSLRTTRTGDSGVRAHAQTDVPLAEMIEKKGQQTQEMQVQYARARPGRGCGGPTCS